MRRISVLVLASALLIFPVTPVAGARKKAMGSWSFHLRELKRQAARVGVQVTSLETGRVVWSHRARIPLVPASLIKLLTSYAAFRDLGPYYRFTTAFYSESRPNRGRVAGNLYIKGEGDPFFFARDAWQMVFDLKMLGVRSIAGGVYIDDSFFDPAEQKICIDGKRDRWYNPTITATALEFNSVTVAVVPGDKVAGPAHIDWFPPNRLVTIDNRTRTGTKYQKTRLFIRLRPMRSGDRYRLLAKGVIPYGHPKGRQDKISIPRPALYWAAVFKELLREAGIKVKGRCGERPLPPRRVRILVHRSPPLADMLYGLNRYSNNFMAEMLVRVLGARQGGVPGSLWKGVTAVKKALTALGISGKEIHLDAGSGLSRSTRVSPRTFNRVLKAVYGNDEWRPEFVSSLARNGLPGTLKHRLRHTAKGFCVRGKTGTLIDVVGFSGYLFSGRQHNYIVTVILNGVKSVWRARQALDDLLNDIPRLARR